MAIDLQRILVPIEFSCHGKRARELANTLAEQFKLEIELVHVVVTSALRGVPEERHDARRAAL